MGRSISVLAGAVGLALLVSVAAGQLGGGEEGAKGAAAQPASPRAMGSVYFLEGPSLSVDFRGGTLSEFVGALREASPAPVNIAVAREAADLRVPPISLAAVSVHSALQVASGVVERPKPSELRVDRIAGTFEKDGTPASAAAFALSLDAPRGSGTPAAAGAELRVYSLREVLREKGVSAESALTAVEAALSLSEGGGREPQVKFHEDTAMLIVRGTPEEQRVVDELVGQLVSAAVEARERRAQAELADLELDFEHKKAEAELEIARGRAERMQREAAQAEQRYGAAGISESELWNVKERLAAAQAEERLAKERVEMLFKKKSLLHHYGALGGGNRARPGEGRGAATPAAPGGEAREKAGERRQERPTAKPE